MALEIERAEGLYLYTPEGKAYLDLISGISVSNVGHRHPTVLAAIQGQLQKHLHLMVYGEYIQSPQVQLATALSELLPGLDSVYFVNSGTEATEGAIKLSRRVTGRKKIFSFENAYHGSTTGALSLMSSDYFKSPFAPLLPEVCHLRPNDTGDLKFIDGTTAAVVVEIIRGEAGAEPMDTEFLHHLRQRCTETGALLIVDEIQSGFGRTGHFFACTAAGIQPDIILMAKGMGGGMPIGAFMASRSLMQSLTHDPVLGHITTFGGHPVSCAASLATLKLIRDGRLYENALVLEQIFRKRLVDSRIRNISGRGLMLALDLGEAEYAGSVIRRCIEKGLITDWFLFAPQKLRVCPPLTMRPEEAEMACDIILASL
jgi:acetylornithine/succinyldiaminopimelate/putrescine aminotransferase